MEALTNLTIRGLTVSESNKLRLLAAKSKHKSAAAYALALIKEHLAACERARCAAPTG